MENIYALSKLPDKFMALTGAWSVHMLLIFILLYHCKAKKKLHRWIFNYCIIQETDRYLNEGRVLSNEHDALRITHIARRSCGYLIANYSTGRDQCFVRHSALDRIVISRSQTLSTVQ